ncbi:MAG: hypothetical protein AAF690_17760 [Acidobacteriota bacterium]
MLQPREDLALGKESALDVLRGARPPQDLDRHLLFELAVIALGEVNAPHAAATDLLERPVGAETWQRAHQVDLGADPSDDRFAELLEELLGFLLSVEVRSERSALVFRQFPKEPRPVLGLQLQRLAEQVVQPAHR